MKDRYKKQEFKHRKHMLTIYEKKPILDYGDLISSKCDKDRESM